MQFNCIIDQIFCVHMCGYVLPSQIVECIYIAVSKCAKATMYMCTIWIQQHATRTAAARAAAASHYIRLMMCACSRWQLMQPRSSTINGMAACRYTVRSTRPLLHACR